MNWILAATQSEGERELLWAEDEKKREKNKRVCAISASPDKRALWHSGSSIDFVNQTDIVDSRWRRSFAGRLWLKKALREILTPSRALRNRGALVQL